MFASVVVRSVSTELCCFQCPVVWHILMCLYYKLILLKLVIRQYLAKLSTLALCSVCHERLCGTSMSGMDIRVFCSLWHVTTHSQFSIFQGSKASLALWMQRWAKLRESIGYILPSMEQAEPWGGWFFTYVWLWSVTDKMFHCLISLDHKLWLEAKYQPLVLTAVPQIFYLFLVHFVKRENLDSCLL